MPRTALDRVKKFLSDFDERLFGELEYLVGDYPEIPLAVWQRLCDVLTDFDSLRDTLEQEPKKENL